MSIVELEGRELELEPPGGGLWSDALRKVIRNPGAIIGFVLVGSLVFVAIFAPLLAPVQPDRPGPRAGRGRLLPRPLPGASRWASTISGAMSSRASSTGLGIRC